MFAWTKKGLVFDTARQGVGGWMRHSALTPTPYRLDDELIRVYGGFRDADGVSRIGYVDVRADDPAAVVRVRHFTQRRHADENHTAHPGAEQ